MKKQDSTQTPSSKPQISEGINKFRIVVSSLGFIAAGLVEFYFFINYSQQFIPITLLGVIMLGLLYVIISEVILYVEQMETRKSEEYENLFKSEKAAYLLMRKSFRDIEEKTNMMMENSTFPVEEILEKEKGIAKIIISKNKENSIVLQQMSEALLEKVESINSVFDTNSDSLLTKQELLMESRNKEVLAKQQEILQALSKLNMDTIDKQSKVLESNRDAEIIAKQQEVILQMRILEEVVRNSSSVAPVQRVEYVKEVVRQPEVEESSNTLLQEEIQAEKVEMNPITEEVVTSQEIKNEEISVVEKMPVVVEEELVYEEEPISEEVAVVEEVPVSEAVEVIEEVSTLEAPQITEEVLEEPIGEIEQPYVAEEPEKELSVEEIVAMSDSLLKGENEILSNFSDSITVGEEPEVAVEPEPTIEEEPALEPEPVLEPEMIPEPEAMIEPEPVIEEQVEPIPVMEEKSAYVPPADPNKKMSPEEIAALIASMG